MGGKSGLRGKRQKAEANRAACPQGEVLAGPEQGIFQVRLNDGRLLKCHVSGYEMGRATPQELRRVLPRIGDRVWVEVNPYDPERGRIRLRFGVIRKWPRNREGERL